MRHQRRFWMRESWRRSLWYCFSFQLYLCRPRLTHLLPRRRRRVRGVIPAAVLDAAKVGSGALVLLRFRAHPLPAVQHRGALPQGITAAQVRHNALPFDRAGARTRVRLCISSGYQVSAQHLCTAEYYTADADPICVKYPLKSMWELQGGGPRAVCQFRSVSH